MTITRKIIHKEDIPLLSAEQKERLEALKDRPIDLSDAPEQLEWSNAVRGKSPKNVCPSMMKYLNGYKRTACPQRYVLMSYCINSWKTRGRFDETIPDSV